MKKTCLIFIVLSLLVLTGCSKEKKSDENSDAVRTELKNKADKTLKDVTGMTSKEIDKEAAKYNGIKKYPIKSGIITFNRKGINGENKIVVYFDDYGSKERSETFNSDDKIEEIRFSDGDKMYIINYKYGDGKTAYIQGSGKYGTEMKFVADPFRKDEDRQKYGYKKLPNMNIAGKDCEAYRMESKMGETTFAGWNNLTLYSKTKIKIGETVKKAVKIEENVSVDPALFKVPDGIAVKNM